MREWRKLFKGELVWRTRILISRNESSSELDLLPLCKHHLNILVLAQVGQGGGLKVPHNDITKASVNLKFLTSVFKLFLPLSLTFFYFMC